jgi:hypothetical protein
MGRIVNYAVVRRDITYAVIKNPRLDKFAKYIFLALTAECHGLPYTTIDLESMSKNWDVSTSTVSRAIQVLEEEGMLIQSSLQNNRTKRKFMAKWLDSDLSVGGYEAGGKAVTRQNNYLVYPDEVIAEKKAVTTRRLDYMADMLNPTPDKVDSTTDKVGSTTDKVVPLSGGHDSPSEGSVPVGDKLKRKEEKEETRRDKTISLSPSENANPKDVIKDKVRRDQKWEKSSDLNHLKRMFSLVNGDEEYFKQLVDQATNGNQFYSEFKDDLERLITTLVKKRDAEKTNLLMGDLNNVSFDGIKIPENLRGLERNVWAYFMLYGDEEVKDEFEDLSTKNSHSRTPQVNVEQMINFINNNGTRFNR